MTKALVLTAVLALSAGGVAEGATDQAPPRVAFFGFQLINTSLQSTTAEEKARIRMLDDAFRKKLGASGRFKIVLVPSDVLREVAAAPEISNCNGCEREFAIKAGADWAAWGTVQKVSNLILNINVYIEDERQKKMEFVKSVDIRGNTDGLGNAASTTCFVTICSATLMITRLSSATPKLCRGFVAMTQTRD